MDIRQGMTIQDDNGYSYRVLRRLGSGGFGVVFLVQRETDNLFFALKTLRTDEYDDAELRALKEEANLATLVRGQHVIEVFYFHDGLHNPTLPPYLLMQYADGGSLKDLLEEKRASSEQFRPEAMRQMMIELSTGMKVINDTVIHRDIQPGNILIREGRLHISDFGLSKVRDAATRTVTFKGIQHIRYKPPEQWDGGKITIQSDMYSMGIVWFEIATLRHPAPHDVRPEAFDEWSEFHRFKVFPRARSINNDVPKHIGDLITRMTEKQPSNRPKRWRDILDALEQDPAAPEVESSFNFSTMLESLRDRRAVEIAQQEDQRQQQERRAMFERRAFQRFVAVRHLFRECAEEFNQQAQADFLCRVQESETGIAIQFPATLVTASLQPDDFSHTELLCGSQHVLAWGILSRSDGLGANLILLEDNDQDLAGSWHVLEHRRSPWISRPFTAVQPFAIRDLSGLRRRISMMSAMDVLSSERLRFDAAYLSKFVSLTPGTA